MALDEFALIQQYFCWPAGQAGVVLGNGDDAAVLRSLPGQDQVICTDTLVAGCHFDAQVRPYDLGWKALAVNLSDLAAMGAEPLAFTLALTLPQVDAPWLSEFARGLRALADPSGMDLIGGDTTRGPLSITITAIGCVPAGQAIARRGAQVGDALWVSGSLGDAALALRLGPAATPDLALRLHRPQPRLAAGRALRGQAHALIDISDGLAADLGHLLAAGQVGATLDYQSIPRSPAFLAAAPAATDAWDCLLHGGDDYELLASLPAGMSPPSVADATWTQIGRITRELGLRLRTEDGSVHTVPIRGWNAFT